MQKQKLLKIPGAFPQKVAFPQGRKDLGLRASELRQFLDFLSRHLEAARNEYNLRAYRKVDFLYLVDFQEIFNYVAPYMENRLRRVPNLAGHFTSRHFFEGLEESFALPLGTLAELSVFLQHVRRSVRHLREIVREENSDRAVDAFVKYFDQEGFLSVDQNLLGSGIVEGDEYRVQKAAIGVLSNYEKGLEKLHAILTHKNLVNLSTIVGQAKLPAFEERYHQTFRELSDGGSKHRKRFGNQADAYNLALVSMLNVHLGEQSSSGLEARATCVKLVTDTNAILYLPQRSSIDLNLTLRNFRDLGYSIDLIEQYEVVILKRLARRYIATHGSERLDEFLEITRAARRSLEKIEVVAADEGIDLAVLLDSLLAPQNNRDRSRILRTHNYIDDLCDFFLKEREVIGDLRARELRQQLVMDTSSSAEISERPSVLAAESVASIEGLIMTIEGVLATLDPLSFEMTPIQRGDEREEWTNPVLSLSRLGFHVETSGDHSQDSYIWMIRQSDSSDSVLRIELDSAAWVATWSSTLPFAECLGVIVDENLFQSGIDDLVTIRLMGAFKEDLVRSVAPTDIVNVVKEFGTPTFIRVDFSAVSLVVELFSINESLSLKSGLIMDRDGLDTGLIKRLFFALSPSDKNPLLRSMIVREIDAAFMPTIRGEQWPLLPQSR